MATNINWRRKYQPIIDKLGHRIDVACRDWVETGDPRALHEYDMLVQEMIEIKESIIKSEEDPE